MQTSILLSVLTFGSLVYSHMEMMYPPPLRSKYNPLVLANAAGSVDYSMTSPLSGAAQYPCKGYQSDLGTAAGASVATWAAGSTVNFTITGSASHGGGSCQASLSYDKGVSWTVIASYIGACPLTPTIDVTIPSDAAAGTDVLFGWTWYNQIGNREIYMNCANVDITAATSKKARAATTPFASRPGPFVANLANGCTTVEGKDVVFPNPGPDVTSASTVTDDSGSFTGTCAAVNGIGDTTSGSAAASGSSPASSAVVAQSSATATSTPTTMSTVVAPTTTVVASSADSSLPGGVFATVPAVSASAVPTASATPSSAATSAPSSTGTGSTSSTGSQTGACTSEGMFNCISGTSYQQCASGTWSVVMPVAAGTTCTTGQSMSLDIGFASTSRRSIRRHFRKHI